MNNLELIEVSSLGVKSFNDNYIKERREVLLKMKESAAKAILKLYPTQKIPSLYVKIQEATKEWDILFLSAQVADIINERKT